jgi:hypothetical protein
MTAAKSSLWNRGCTEHPGSCSRASAESGGKADRDRPRMPGAQPAETSRSGDAELCPFVALGGNGGALGKVLASTARTVGITLLRLPFLVPTAPWCMDRRRGRGEPSPHPRSCDADVLRASSGRPSSSMRFGTPAAMAAPAGARQPRMGVMARAPAYPLARDPSGPPRQGGFRPGRGPCSPGIPARHRAPRRRSAPCRTHSRRQASWSAAGRRAHSARKAASAAASPRSSARCIRVAR